MSNYFKEGEESNSSQNVEMTGIQKVKAYYNAIRDKIQRYVYERWGVLAVLLFIYILSYLY